jgi:predicted ferric reductase
MPTAKPASDRTTPTASSVSGSGRAGVSALLTVFVANIVLWVVARPAGQPAGRFVGELCGSEAVLLFSCALVLATLLRPIERAFGGLDRVALWHRRAAVAGVVLLIPHVALVNSAPDRYGTSFGHALGDGALVGLLVLAVWALAPGLRAARWPGVIRRMAQATYERWLTAHRLTGVFVIAAVVHGAIVDPVLHRSPLLHVVFLAIGAVGIVAYLYRELLARYFVPIYDYTVANVRQVNQTTLGVTLAPVRKSLSFTPGQFVFLALGGASGWERHPFSVSSSPNDSQLELTIKASGDYTRELYDKLRTGVPAKLAGPFGGFDYREGGRDQIWIARRDRGHAVCELDPLDRRAVRAYGRLLLRGCSRRRRALSRRHPGSDQPAPVSAPASRVCRHRRPAHARRRGPCRLARSQPLGVHVRTAPDDEGLLRRTARARHPQPPHSVGTVRHSLSSDR